jgi:hypothetical protein
VLVSTLREVESIFCLKRSKAAVRTVPELKTI